MDEVNEHAEIIRNSVFHSYPYKRFGLNPSEPHADDCEGCIINAEVDKLVAKLHSLSNVEKIKADAEHEREELRLLKLDRWRAFEKVGVIKEGGSVADLVGKLVEERDSLLELIETIDIAANDISRRIRRRKPRDV